jgi:hypothetical protein
MNQMTQLSAHILERYVQGTQHRQTSLVYFAVNIFACIDLVLNIFSG